jgi:hypothetical protein
MSQRIRAERPYPRHLEMAWASRCPQKWFFKYFSVNKEYFRRMGFVGAEQIDWGKGIWQTDGGERLEEAATFDDVLAGLPEVLTEAGLDEADVELGLSKAEGYVQHLG